MSFNSEPSAAPKYQQLIERFRRQIVSGQLQPGDRLPSLKEMYATEGISRPTLEKAYALLEREQLIERQHGAGVFVRHKPQSTPRNSTAIIGLSGSGFHFRSYSPYWAELMGGVREAAEKSGFQVLLLDAKESQGWDKVDGVILCDWNDARFPRKNLPGMPLVSMMTLVNGMASIAIDDYAGMYQATQALIEMGHEKIGYMHSYLYDPIARARFNGFCDALSHAQIRLNPDIVRLIQGELRDSGDYINGARKIMSAWLDDFWKKSSCSALLCHNDETALGAIQAFRAKGIRVPEDVSIVGFDGTEFCELVSPTLTSLEIPLREIGAQSVELLLQQIASEQLSSEHRVLSPQFKARESTIAFEMRNRQKPKAASVKQRVKS